MKPPQEPLEPHPDALTEIARDLFEVERSLLALKQRYNQVQTDLQRQAQLQQRLKQLDASRLPNKAELRHIKQQLEAIEVNLESQLFSWGSWKEPFWQAVRFGGLGIIVGWILKSCSN